MSERHEHPHEHQRPLEPEQEAPVVRDKRRIDPVTGEVRQAPDQPVGSAAGVAPGDDAPAAEPVGATSAEQPAGQPAQLAELTAQLAERTADLQRVSAEYANYRRRVDRDREAVRDQAVAAVLAELLPVADNIDRAREHGELVGGFKSVADAIESAFGKLGLERYGEPGDEFDPMVHEAMTHAYSPDVDTTTCVQVFQPGYRLGERVLRPARVAVAEPEAGPPPGREFGPGEGPGPVPAGDDLPGADPQ